MIVHPKIKSRYLIDKLPQLLSATSHIIPQGNTRIGYINLYHKKGPISNEDIETPIIIEEIRNVIKACLGSENLNIISFGFIYSNPGCDTQRWHIDYGGDTDTFFIPMCDIDETNGTEFLDYADAETIKPELLTVSNRFLHNTDLHRYLSLILGIHEYSLRVLAAPAMSLVKMPSHVLHRGRTNASGRQRVMFQIVTSNAPDLDILREHSVKDAELDEPAEVKKIMEARSTSFNGSAAIGASAHYDSFYRYDTAVRGAVDAELALAASIASASSRPFFVVNLSTVSRKLAKWKACLPRVKPFYAVKSNNDSVICRLLANGGCGFDCASQAELEQVLGLGVPPDRVVFANPCKQSSMIKYARGAGVKLMTADHADELVKIKECSPDASVLIRIAVDDSRSACKFNTKFGAHEDELDHMFATALRVGVRIAGFSYHVGSGCSDPQPFADAVSISKRAFDKANACGLNPEILDIGGGFYGHDDEEFERVAKTVAAAIDLHFPRESNVEIIAEPGRYFCTASHTYAAEVIAKKKASVFINDGVYGCFNCVLLDNALPLAPHALNGGNAGPLTPTKIFGPTCDSLDVVAENVLLPELSVGDWIYVRNMGAYTRSSATLFNGQGKYEVHYVWIE